MTSKLRQSFYMLLAGVFLLAACAPAQATQSPQDIQNQISTAVAMTVEIQSLQTQAAQASLPTFTPIPSPTLVVDVPTATPVVPTATPFVIAPATSSGSGGGGGGTSKAKYSCDPDTGKRPRDNAEYRPGDSFDVKWTIINTGTATWPAGTDLKYWSGPKMTSASLVQLPELKPGDKYSIVFDANAPAEKGFQVMTWNVGGWCYPYVAIVVQ